MKRSKSKYLIHLDTDVFSFFNKVDFTLAITLVLRNSGDSIREKLCEVRLDNLQFIKIKPTSQFRYATQAFIF